MTTHNLPPSTLFAPQGGLSGQTQIMTDRAVFTEAYAVIPKGVMQDIVTSNLPFWDKTRAWVIARPLSGFAETFAQYIMELQPEGGSAQPEPDTAAQGVFFVVQGEITVTYNNEEHVLPEGGYAYLPAGAKYEVRNNGNETAVFHWVRKQYDVVEGIEQPEAFFTHEKNATVAEMPDTNGAWKTTRFVDPADLRHDMHVNIVTFEPGGCIPFAETHVMEHGLYVLEGKAVYRLNQDWVEVEAGDFMWLRAFCPQACYAGGPTRFRYLLYKDVNRHAPLGSFQR
ncbi:bifunctional allantoicase/(S)-ureidoglycine aminohydrolase [Flexibacterium corallicola]|uniref:bifunctional allantoicase/(S)-ureidoglycine aminohydrolase n=1 Tax=Flexibacterium corallicola TaxID=3037259 RepID=UPI00286F8AE9|nr:bifunctional allantoicase/(S)-ureidoglycine aminohydrolase [Pseudovibrio sp. M1P-2-3]